MGKGILKVRVWFSCSDRNADRGERKGEREKEHKRQSIHLFIIQHLSRRRKEEEKQKRFTEGGGKVA